MIYLDSSLPLEVFPKTVLKLRVKIDEDLACPNLSVWKASSWDYSSISTKVSKLLQLIPENTIEEL